MIVYHGTNQKILNFFTIKNGRYRFPTLFASDSINLSKLYGPNIYKLRILRPSKTVDFKNHFSYHSSFRNLIISNKSQKSVLIKNVIDYPNEKHAHFNTYNIVVIYSPAQIIDGHLMSVLSN